MNYHEIEIHPEVTSLQPKFEENGLDWKSHLNLAIKQSSEDIATQPRDVVIGIIVGILKQELRACIIRKLEKKAEKPATSTFGRIWRAILKMLPIQN